MASSSRIPSLDGLRALSISFVLIGHFAFSSGFPIQRSWLTDIYAHYGVRIFFVISGFLITTLLIEERKKTGKIDLKQFYIRRAYRIFPAAYFYLLVVTVVFYSSLSFKYLAAAYTYMTSYAIHSPWILRHLWSLSGGRAVLHALAGSCRIWLLYRPAYHIWWTYFRTGSSAGLAKSVRRTALPRSSIRFFRASSIRSRRDVCWRCTRRNSENMDHFLIGAGFPSSGF